VAGEAVSGKLGTITGTTGTSRVVKSRVLKVGDHPVAGENITSPKVANKELARQRWSISFPYVDLGAAFTLAQAIHGHAGHGSCSEDELAAWTEQSAKSSGFREQIRAAKMAWLVEGDADALKLSEIGRAIADPDQDRQARARAFLAVPLFKDVYEKYRGTILPPAAALERDMVGLGVPEKQKDLARQVLERSAEQAGFFENGKTKLVMPALAQDSGGHVREATRDGGGITNSVGGSAGSAGSGGVNGGQNDPLIKALIQKLPAGGSWPTDDRINWLKMLVMGFQVAYGSDAEIEIKKKELPAETAPMSRIGEPVK
jgi:hypothetical protein